MGTVCAPISSITASKPPVFSPQHRAQLKAVVDACIIVLNPCTSGKHGPVREWDVSKVSDMSRMFSGASVFNGDLSKWDVSTVTNMWGMFEGASSFNGDLSQWDVSSVTTMRYMFRDATSF